MKRGSMNSRVVKTDKGYFFDTEAGYFIKISAKKAKELENE